MKAKMIASSVIAAVLLGVYGLARIHAAEDADAIIYDQASNRIFTFNGDAHSSTVIDPAGTLITNLTPSPLARSAVPPARAWLRMRPCGSQCHRPLCGRCGSLD